MILFACCVAGMRTEFVGGVFKQGFKVPAPAPLLSSRGLTPEPG